ncbi:anti-sigma-D factor RsdA [Mycolicibacterium baixiangningiae]|uniref:anti-sigma-D factor RsdA n=1 Tax=Mycolicibacterium baixiangningiae TaxID=2761578 RepID=UPI001866DA19|nr:anti-sigma-D factor RsdA [Mycolicibacterium baixiangningiae]
MPDFTRWSSNGGDPSLPEINHTDRLLDALAMEQPVYSNEPGEGELAYLLAGWRDDVRQPPMAAVLTPRDAAIALDRAVSTDQRTTQRRRFSLAVVGSVAAAVLCLGGFGSVVYGAGPGDPLYGVRTMLFGEQQATRDDQVALAAQTQMAQVQQLIEQGDWTAAQDKLQTLTTTVAAVGDTNRQQELVDQWQQLSVKVEAQDPAATVPPDAPPVVLPEVPSDLPLPLLLTPDATSPSSGPATPSSTDPSVTPSDSPSATPSDVPTSSPPDVPTSSPPASTSPPAPSATPSTAPTPAPSSVAPSSAPQVPATTPSPAATTLPPPTTTVARTTTTTVAPPVDEPEVQVPTQPAPTVEQPQIAAPTLTTTTVLPLPGSGSEEE